MNIDGHEVPTFGRPKAIEDPILDDESRPLQGAFDPALLAHFIDLFSFDQWLTMELIFNGEPPGKESFQFTCGYHDGTMNRLIIIHLQDTFMEKANKILGYFQRQS